MPTYRMSHDLKTRAKHMGKWSQDEKDQIKQSYQECFDELERHVEMAKAEDKILFVKEHCYFLTEPVSESKLLFGEDSVNEPQWTAQVPSTYGAAEPTHSSANETILPDEFLHCWHPTFLIRHPALVFPSLYRALSDNEEIEQKGKEELAMKTTFHWTRSLYDWYHQHLSKSKSELDGEVTWPIVLDADDVMLEPAVIVHFCEIVGLDPSKLRFEWSPASKEDLEGLQSDVVRRMLSTLSASEGVMKGKASTNIDIDSEARQWREEFGEVEGEKVESWVRDAMPDYDFLKSKRLRPKPV